MKTNHSKRRAWPAVLLIAAVLALAVTACVLIGTTVIDRIHTVTASDVSQPATVPSVGPTSGTTAPAPTTESTEVPTTLLLDGQTVEITARCAVLYDMTAGRMLYTKQPQQVCAPASLTKMAVAATALSLCPADTCLTVGNEIDRMDPEASRAYLKKGQEYHLIDLAAALLLPSGSDAAYCIAAGVGRQVLGANADEQAAIDCFMEQVNAFVKRVGAVSTHFVTPDGMPDPTHLTTAEDLLCILRYCMQDKDLSRVMGAARWGAYTTSGYGVTFQNTNLLLRKDSEYYYASAIAGKTGFTDQAGYCLAAAARQDGHTLLAVVLGTPQAGTRFTDARTLFEKGFAALQGKK
ncbi:MAG: D-alanyl-D-alanine carboxypeptidase [Clostridia bacterium]|nr:D-alanyl-D-alanine carboxypeptidase [Clostridia bacterium]